MHSPKTMENDSQNQSYEEAVAKAYHAHEDGRPTSRYLPTILDRLQSNQVRRKASAYFTRELRIPCFPITDRYVAPDRQMHTLLGFVTLDSIDVENRVQDYDAYAGFGNLDAMQKTVMKNAKKDPHGATTINALDADKPVFPTGSMSFMTPKDIWLNTGQRSTLEWLWDTSEAVRAECQQVFLKALDRCERTPAHSMKKKRQVALVECVQHLYRMIHHERTRLWCETSFEALGYGQRPGFRDIVSTFRTLSSSIEYTGDNL